MERLIKLDIPLSDKLDRVINPDLTTAAQSKVYIRPKVELFSSPDWTKLWISRIKKNTKNTKFSRNADHFVLAQANNLVLNKEGLSSLQQAAYYGQVKIMKRLIKEGADLNHEDWSGNTALLYAINSNQPEAVKILVENKGLTICQKFGDRHETALIKAIKLGYLDTVRELLRRPEAILKQDIDGRTPLFHAVLKGNIKILEMIMRISANENDLIDYKGINALQIAMENGETRVIKTLLSYKDFEITTEIGQQLLILGCYLDDVDIIKGLLSRRIDTNCICPESGKTPIFIAYSLGFNEVVNELVNVSNDEILDLKSKQDDSILFMACRQNDHVLVSRLLRCGANPNIQTSFKKRPLHISSELGFDKVVKFLLAHSADIDCQDFQLETPLMLAVQHKNKSVISVLLENKPLTCITNLSNKRAIDMADSIGIKDMIEEYMFKTPEKQSPEYNIVKRRMVRHHSKHPSSQLNESILKLIKSTTSISEI